MSFLRRAAVRALLAQPSKQIATSARFSTRVTSLSASRPSTIRSFHQSRLVRAEEEQKPEEARPVDVEASDETVPNEPSASEEAAPPTSGRAQPFDASAPGIFLRNLSFDVSPEMLEEEFSRIGKVTKTTILKDSNGLSRGVAFVDFATKEEAEQAIEQYNETEYMGRTVFIEPVRRKERFERPARPAFIDNPPSKTLFVGNLSFDMSDRDLNDLFRNMRNVVDVRIAVDRRSGQPRGFGHVDFIDIASAERGKELLESKEVFGRKLKVNFGKESRPSYSDNRYSQRGASNPDGARRAYGGERSGGRPYQRRDAFGSERRERRPYPRREDSSSGYPRRDSGYGGRDGPSE